MILIALRHEPVRRALAVVPAAAMLHIGLDSGRVPGPPELMWIVLYLSNALLFLAYGLFRTRRLLGWVWTTTVVVSLVRGVAYLIGDDRITPLWLAILVVFGMTYWFRDEVKHP